jgi:hypothetical protein
MLWMKYAYDVFLKINNGIKVSNEYGMKYGVTLP